MRKSLIFLFDIQDDKIIHCNTDYFECLACGKRAKGVAIIGKTTNQYKSIKGLRRRLLIEVKKDKPCDCVNEIWMSNTTKVERESTEEVKKDKPCDMETDLSKPFFIKIGLSARGRRAGLEIRQDGIYTKSNRKLCNRVLPVR